MKTLHLNLKRKWFDLILSGEKTEEYRGITEYWYGRLIDRENLRSFKKATLAINIDISKNDDLPELFWKQMNECFEGCFEDFDTITFSNGYSKNRDQFVIEFKGIEIREGNPKWGAEEGEKYFVLKLGKLKN